HTSMQGTVSAPMKASPPNGGVTTVFTITWATGGVPAGFDVQIQISRPGGPGFVLWKDNQTAQSATFVPDMGTGVYKFRARLQNPVPLGFRPVVWAGLGTGWPQPEPRYNRGMAKKPQLVLQPRATLPGSVTVTLPSARPDAYLQWVAFWREVEHRMLESPSL